MKAWQTLANAWRRFLFEPSSTLPLCVFRILYGLLSLECAYLVAPDFLDFFGPHAVVGAELMRKLLGKSCLDILLYLPQTDSAAYIFFAVFVLSALCVTLGLFTRVASIVLYLTLSSLHYRNPIVINSGDDLLRVYSFFMMFAPAGDQLSLDSLIRKARNKDAKPTLRSPWPLRMIQLEITLIYLQYTATKLLDRYWLDGTAVYYVLQCPDLEHYPLFFDRHNLLIAKLFTWGTLLVEFALCSLIWVKDFRYWVLALGVFFHFGLDYCLNIPIFQHIILCSYVLFIDPADLERFIRAVQSRIGIKPKGGDAMVLQEGA